MDIVVRQSDPPQNFLLNVALLSCLERCDIFLLPTRQSLSWRYCWDAKCTLSSAPSSFCLDESASAIK